MYDSVKESVVRLALREAWSLEQIQFAEIYINERRTNQRFKRPIELEAKNARKIRDRMRVRRASS